MISLPKSAKSTGQSLIGILIAMAIFALLANAIFTLVTSSYRLIGFTRARISARHLAQDRMEFIRNLAYDSVGTSGGIPGGPLLQTENVHRNGLNFTVKTSIIYVDDVFDLTVPNDLLPTDYKRVRIEVSWDGIAASRKNPVVLVSDISPKGVETTVGGGTLSILVFDASGEPVPQANVSIQASSTEPQIDLDLQTQDNGRIILPGAPACVSCYEITVTKSGFSTDRTYSTVEIANPVNPNSTVLEGDLTEVSFAIDQLSEITIQTTDSRESGFVPLPNTSLTLRGSKIIGTDALGQEIYKYEDLIITDGSGSIDLDLEWDVYNITPSHTPSLDIAGASPFLPYSLNPNEDVEIRISLVPQSTNSYLVLFTSDGHTPVASVSAQLVGTDFDETIFSGAETDPDFGQVFFSNLNMDEYSIFATASGYLDYSSVASMSGTVVETVLLQSQ